MCAYGDVMQCPRRKTRAHALVPLCMVVGLTQFDAAEFGVLAIGLVLCCGGERHGMQRSVAVWCGCSVLVGSLNACDMCCNRGHKW